MGIFRDFTREAGSKSAKEVAAVRDTDQARCTAALQAANSCVMIADENNVIVKMNPAATRMMQKVEGDLRKELPNFSVAKIVGSNIDQLHKHPPHQNKLMAELNTTYHTTIEVGPIHFDLTANPIFDEQRQRIGTVVEWEDITERLTAEKKEKQVAEQEHVKAAESARIRSALDIVTSNVMVADTDNVIVYANESVLSMLRDAESDLRTQLPDFRADEIVGSNVDVFYRNLANQQNILASLDTTHEAKIEISDQHYKLKASPVKNDSGERVGTVVELIDLIDEVTFDESVSQVISAALKGDLSSRIETRKGCSEFIAAAGSSINDLLENFGNVLRDADKAISALSEGRLTEKMQGDYEGDYATLKNGINQTIDKLISVVTDITNSSNRVKSAAGEISSGNSNLSQRTEQQAASLEETSSAMEEITATVQQNAENSIQANTLARGARETAENGGSVVGRAVDAMQAISDSSNKITDIIGVIDEIAFQTNLLALNAAVEAARAGDQGRGFAVVADEVRSLAGRSATAAKEIKDLIKDSSEKVNEGSELVNRSGETLGEIVTAVKKVNDIVAEIATASDEQSTGLAEINKAITEMDSMTQQNAALVEEAAAASESMNDQAENLDNLISFFIMGAEAGATRHSGSTPSSPLTNTSVRADRNSVSKETTNTSTPKANSRPDVKPTARVEAKSASASEAAVKPRSEQVPVAETVEKVEKKVQPMPAISEDEGDEWEVF